MGSLRATASLTVRLPLELWRDARQVSSERGQSLSEFVRDAIDRERSLQVDDWHAWQRSRHPDAEDHRRELWRSERARKLALKGFKRT